jgi:hypothetical protein
MSKCATACPAGVPLTLYRAARSGRPRCPAPGVVPFEQVDAGGEAWGDFAKHGEVVEVLDLVVAMDVRLQAGEARCRADRELAGPMSLQAVVVGEAF